MSVVVKWLAQCMYVHALRIQKVEPTVSGEQSLIGLYVGKLADDICDSGGNSAMNDDPPNL